MGPVLRSNRTRILSYSFGLIFNATKRDFLVVRQLFVELSISFPLAGCNTECLVFPSIIRRFAPSPSGGGVALPFRYCISRFVADVRPIYAGRMLKTEIASDFNYPLNQQETRIRQLRFN